MSYGDFEWQRYSTTGGYPTYTVYPNTPWSSPWVVPTNDSSSSDSYWRSDARLRQRIEALERQFEKIRNDFMMIAEIIRMMAEEDCKEGLGECGECLPCRAREAITDTILLPAFEALGKDV